MDTQYLYLFLNIAAISIPFLSSFYQNANFSKKWKYLAPAIIIPGIVFIVWDIYFAQWGVWGFNERYLTGITIVNLPLEEWLFFICIPYACVFTYFSLKHLIKKDFFAPYASAITWVIIFGALLIVSFNIDKAYTATTFIFLAVFLLLHLYVFKSNYLGRFYLTYTIILIPFFLINGILTGSGIEDQVVWYNNAENLELRIATIPIEDAFYGMLLILMNVTVYEELQKKKAENKK